MTNFFAMESNDVAASVDISFAVNRSILEKEVLSHLSFIIIPRSCHGCHEYICQEENRLLIPRHGPMIFVAQTLIINLFNI